MLHFFIILLVLGRIRFLVPAFASRTLRDAVTQLNTNEASLSITPGVDDRGMQPARELTCFSSAARRVPVVDDAEQLVTGCITV
jgi:hypothetical protein